MKTDIPPTVTKSFWTTKQRQGHSLHEISYRACFKPQLVTFFITRYSKPNDTIFDPFMGRGTTPLEAVINGRHAIASDAHPLCLYLARPRLNPPSLAAIQARLHAVPSSADIPPSDRALTCFYHPKTLAALIALKTWLVTRQKTQCFDAIDDWIRMVALSRLSGHSQGFFSVRTMPPNQAISIEAQRKLNARNGQKPPYKDIKKRILKKSQSLLRDGTPHHNQKYVLAQAYSHALSFIADDTIDMIITSPPFLDTVDYSADNWLRCWFAALDQRIIALDHHKTRTAWTDFIRKSFREFARVMKPNGYIAFEVGEVRKNSIFLEQDVLQATQYLPFIVRKIYINQQTFTKTANCWGVTNNQKGTNSNRIIIFQKRP